MARIRGICGRGDDWMARRAREKERTSVEKKYYREQKTPQVPVYIVRCGISKRGSHVGSGCQAKRRKSVPCQPWADNFRRTRPRTLHWIFLLLASRPCPRNRSSNFPFRLTLYLFFSFPCFLLVPLPRCVVGPSFCYLLVADITLGGGAPVLKLPTHSIKHALG